MASDLLVGAVLTLAAYIGLQVSVLHGKFVIERMNSEQREPLEDPEDA